MRILVMLGALFAVAAHAAIVSESDAQWQLADGSKVYSSWVTEAQCWTAYPLKKAELASRTSGQLYLGCQKKNLLKFGATPPPPVCAAPKPLADTQTSQCPVGTIGTYGQTREFIVAPYPQCWAPGTVWVNVDNPATVCVTPPAPAAWTHCVGEWAGALGGANGVCNFTGPPREARFGVGTQWSLTRTLASGFVCNGRTFNTSDPAPGQQKVCETRAPSGEPPPPPPPSGTARLSWQAPTQNTDGSTLTDLAGYYIYYGRSPTELTQSIHVNNPGALVYLVENLGIGTWYFAVSAVSAAGVHSVNPEVVSKAIIE